MISAQRLRSLMILWTVLCLSGVASASNSVGIKHFRFSGFATLGVTKSGDEDLGFHRDLDREGVFDGDWSIAADSLVGVQFDVTVNDQFGGAVQLVGKDRTEDSLENSVEWAFLRYRLNPNWTVRAGRIGYDLFMLSDYRNVGFAYLWTRPPIEFYAPLTFTGFNGGDIAWAGGFGGGTLTGKIAYGNTACTFNILGNLVDIEARNIIAATLSWESDRWQFKLNASDTQVGEKGGFFPGSAPLANILQQVSPIWPEVSRVLDDFYVSNSHIFYYAAGLAYNSNPWQIQAEISRTDPKLNLYPSTLQAYVSAGYKVQAFTPYLMISGGQVQEDAKQAPDAPVLPSAPQISGQLVAIQQGVQSVYDALNTDQTTLTAGMRWDIRYDTALKVQLDHSWSSSS